MGIIKGNRDLKRLMSVVSRENIQRIKVKKIALNKVIKKIVLVFKKRPPLNLNRINRKFLINVKLFQ